MRAHVAPKKTVHLKRFLPVNMGNTAVFSSRALIYPKFSVFELEVCLDCNTL